MKEKMSTVEVLDTLKKMFPHFSSQLDEAIHAVESPLQRFCKVEAEYRLEEAEFPYDTEEERQLLVNMIANELFRSETFVDGEVAEYITEDCILDYYKRTEPAMYVLRRC